MRKWALAAVSAVTVAASAGAASAAVITEIATGQGDKLFTTEIKRDQNVDNNAQRGHDVFLRNGEGFSGPSFNVNWGASGTSYDWSVSYDSDEAFLTFAGFDPIKIDVDPDGDWNAFQFFVRASDNTRFENESTTVTVDEINGMATVFEAIGDGNGAFDKAFTLSDLSVIETIRGTVTFDFDILDGAKGSPNSRLAFNLKALSIDPAVVPVPAALPLFLTALAGLGAVARRRRKK